MWREDGVKVRRLIQNSRWFGLRMKALARPMGEKDGGPGSVMGECESSKFQPSETTAWVQL